MTRPLALLGGLLAVVPFAHAQEAKPVEPKWGFSGNLGTGGAGGDFGNLFEKPITGEYSFFHQNGAWRFGMGIGLGSFKMQPPYEDEKEWGFLRTYLFGTRMLRTEGLLRPYIQGRAGLARLHPRSLLFAPVPLPPDLQPGDSPTEPANGFMVGVVPGLEIRLGRTLFLDASVAWTYFKTDEYDLSPVNQPPRSSGTALEARLGATWFPLPDDPTRTSGTHDAWGVKRSYAWAAGEMLAVNVTAGLVNEYVRDANFNQTSPRSWWANLKEGFTYDDNQFKTNQWAHPTNGSIYFNSARANGVSFWPSAGFAMAGAFYWECCGETHPMSINDLIATGIGGMALGEAQYRLSSEILNNQSTGKGRFFRELGGFLTDPIRGFNRLLSGDAKSVRDNPENPMDWRPPGGTNFVAVGTESFGDGSIGDDTETYPMILLNHSYGNVFDNDRRKPYDYMDFVGEIDFGEKVSLDNVQIRGNLASWPLGSKTSPNHVLEFVQYFDYMNNEAYEFGGQSLGAALNSRFKPSEKALLTTRVDAIGTILGAVNADYSWLADVADQERIREYDYGPGLGAMAQFWLTWSGHPILRAFYRFQWTDVSNGSVFHKGQLGADADHYIHSAGVRLVIPIKGGLGIGTDFFYMHRDSHYLFTDNDLGISREQDITEHTPQLRIYLSLNSVR